MKITINHILITLVILIALIAGNVYQYQNPKILEVPEGQTEIDSTAWVQRAAYLARGMIIDSLKQQNQKLAERVKKTGDQIAGYTTIIGELKLQVDSLESETETWNAIPLAEMMLERDHRQFQMNDTTFYKTKTFGDGLLQVTGFVRFKDNQFMFDILPPKQLRPVRLDVAQTINDDQSRSLVYVTSTDFKDLKYSTYTELQPEKELPKFWIGAGAGVITTLAVIIFLQ